MQRPPMLKPALQTQTESAIMPANQWKARGQAMLCNERSTGSLPEGEECGT